MSSTTPAARGASLRSSLSLARGAFEARSSSSSTSSSASASRPVVLDGEEEEKGGVAARADGGVRFGSVRVRRHRRILGDNPSVSRGGPPVSLSWTAVGPSERFERVEDFEESRRETTTTRRRKRGAGRRGVSKEGQQRGVGSAPPPRRLTAAERMEIVRGAGHSRESITRARNEIRDILRDRRSSSSSSPVVASEVEASDSSFGDDGAEEEQQHTRPRYEAPLFVRLLRRRATKKNGDSKPMRKVRSHRTA